MTFEMLPSLLYSKSTSTPLSS